MEDIIGIDLQISAFELKASVKCVQNERYSLF